MQYLLLFFLIVNLPNLFFLGNANAFSSPYVNNNTQEAYLCFTKILFMYMELDKFIINVKNIVDNINFIFAMFYVDCISVTYQNLKKLPSALIIATAYL